MVVSWFREMYRVVGRRLVMKAYIVVVLHGLGMVGFIGVNKGGDDWES